MWTQNKYKKPSLAATRPGFKVLAMITRLINKSFGETTLNEKEVLKLIIYTPAVAIGTYILLITMLVVL
ncbi:hypothetical protein [Bombilactobacillus bombi]|uniref:hypothetical protein n=1 Tax=Bombilactobacillus bombi TaxID=1303590 RepID=UPI0035EF8842